MTDTSAWVELTTDQATALRPGTAVEGKASGLTVRGNLFDDVRLEDRGLRASIASSRGVARTMVSLIFDALRVAADDVPRAGTPVTDASTLVAGDRVSYRFGLELIESVLKIGRCRCCLDSDLHIFTVEDLEGCGKEFAVGIKDVYLLEHAPELIEVRKDDIIALLDEGAGPRHVEAVDRLREATR